MSVSFSCHCKERSKPVKERDWEIWTLRCNYSAFNGYHWTPSDYSLIHCNFCGAHGRTKAAYVSQLRMRDDETGGSYGRP